LVSVRKRAAQSRLCPKNQFDLLEHWRTTEATKRYILSFGVLILRPEVWATIKEAREGLVGE
jgi:hypothetical protein